jgi:NAD(P)H dehydrogenase (quinone)
MCIHAKKLGNLIQYSYEYEQVRLSGKASSQPRFSIQQFDSVAGAMHCLVILAHPEPKSFNAQMAQVALQAFRSQGHTAELCDLYQEGFDPCEALCHYPDPVAPDYFRAMVEQRHASDAGSLPPDIQRAIDQLERADLVMFQFPLWWFSMPAILKGWFDRVLVWGRIYSSRRRYDRGHFGGKRALLSITTGAPATAHGPDGRNGDIDLELWPIHFSLHYVGFTVLAPFKSYSVESVLLYSDANALAERLNGYKEGLRDHLQNLEALDRLRFNGWNDWDERGRLKSDAPSYGPFMRHL